MVTEALRLSGREILGFVTPDLEAGTGFCGSTALGDDAVIFDYSADEIELVNGVGVLPGQYLRWKLASTMRERGYIFSTVIHPNATITSEVTIGEGVQVMVGGIIQPGSAIGDDTIINTGAIIDHDCEIGKSCHIAPGVVCSGGVKIGRESHIGTGANIIQNITVGNRCVIAAGTTLYRDIKSGMRIRQQMKIVIDETDIEV